MKRLEKYLKISSSLVLISPILAVVSCGERPGSVSIQHWRRPAQELKAYVPDELFPNIKYDPVGFEKIKDQQKTFAESYDHGGNFLMKNEWMNFKFSPGSLDSKHLQSIQNAKNFVHKSVEEMNLSSEVNNVLIECTSDDEVPSTYFGMTSLNNIKINFKRVEKYDIVIQNYVEDYAATLNHEMGHVITLKPLNRDIPHFSNFYSAFETAAFNKLKKTFENSVNPGLKNFFANATPANFRSLVSDLSLNNRSADAEIQDFLFGVEDARDINWSFEKHLRPDNLLTGEPYPVEAITELQNTFTKKISPSVFTDFSKNYGVFFALNRNWNQPFLTYVYEALNLGWSFHTSLFPLDNDHASLDIMKEIFHEWYDVSTAKIRIWNNVALNFRAVGGNSDQIAKIKITNGINVDELTISHQQIALGFNRNPFTDYEYKYVADDACGSVNLTHNFDQNSKIEFENANGDKINVNAEMSMTS